MKLLLESIKLHYAWLVVIQLIGFFVFYSSKSVVLGTFVITIVSFAFYFLLKLFFIRYIYYFYNQGHSYSKVYCLVSIANILVFSGLCNIINFLAYA